ncbi:MAG: hypothetical protein CMJ19_05035 [Phycisphaeraceae bacterium]|nr:hypothetical protein [Phycisphaeraceae bacterium]
MTTDKLLQNIREMLRSMSDHQMELTVDKYDGYYKTQGFKVEIKGKLAFLLDLSGVKALARKRIDLSDALWFGDEHLRLSGTFRGRIVEEQAVAS